MLSSPMQCESREAAATVHFSDEICSFRFLNQQDLDEVKLLCSQWFPVQYPESWYIDVTGNKKFYSLAAVHRGKIIGIIISEVKSRSRVNGEDGNLLAARFGPNARVAYILSLGVMEQYRRHGLASRLLCKLVHHLTTDVMLDVKAVYLHVLHSNRSAIAFYESKSFRMHAFLPYYYIINGHLEDGYCYVLYINGGEPPWSVIGYCRRLGQLLTGLRPCAMSHAVVRVAAAVSRKLLKSVLGSGISSVASPLHVPDVCCRSEHPASPAT